jgi:hypothetical protein
MWRVVWRNSNLGMAEEDDDLLALLNGIHRGRSHSRDLNSHFAHSQHQATPPASELFLDDDGLPTDRSVTADDFLLTASSSSSFLQSLKDPARGVSSQPQLHAPDRPKVLTEYKVGSLIFVSVSLTQELLRFLASKPSPGSLFL